MATELTMPQMGYDMQEGTILRWLKDEGEPIANGEPIAEIETDKAVVEFESYAEGILHSIIVPAGSVVPVGEPIAVIGSHDEFAAAAPPADEPVAEEPVAEEPVAEEIENEEPPADEPDDAEPAAAEQEEQQPAAAIPMPPASAPVLDEPPAPEPPPEPEPPAAPPAPLRASPIARRIADERGIDISKVQGTGPGGRIVKDDVLAYQEPQPEPEPAPVIVEPVAEPPAAEQPEVIEAEAEAAPEPPVAEPPAAEPVAEADEQPAAETAIDEPEPAPEPEPEAAEPPAAEQPEVIEAEAEAVDEPPAEEPVAEAEPEAEEQPAAEPTPEPEAAEPPAAEQPEVIEAEAEPEPAPEPALEPPPAEPTPADSDAIPLSRMRQQIARVTVRSKQEKPHFYVTSEIDMTEAMALRRQINDALQADGVRVTVNDLIIKACADALKRHPKFNAFLDDDAIRHNDSINIGIAMSVAEGLLMPAIMNCERMSLKELAQASKDLADRAQNATLRPDEYTGGTFGVSNLGMFDVSTFVAIIQPPQTAILAVGTVAKRPVVRNDELVIRQTMNATISADHRVVDGAEGAQFLIDVKQSLENPLSLIL